MKKPIFLVTLLTFVAVSTCLAQSSDSGAEDVNYKLLATTRTSTMQKEVDQAAAKGYRVLVGAPTSGSELILFLAREGTVANPYQYKLLATTRTGTMQNEMNEAANAGYRLIPSTLIAKKQVLGGIEIVMLLERAPRSPKRYEYKLLATSRTSTLQKEATEAKDAGYRIVGMVNRDENIVIMEREVSVTP